MKESWKECSIGPVNNGIKIESNYASLEALQTAVKNGNKNPYILFIKGYEDKYDVSPSYYQGYTLTEVKALRDYLNSLIVVAEASINCATI